MTDNEKTVYDLIVAAPSRITQLEIARLAPQLGSHDIHENYVNPK